VSRYPELAAKVDAFFERVIARHPGDMACNSGCSHCCHVRLSITAVEADAIAALVDAMSPPERTALAANAQAAPADRCRALSPAGRCLVYAARPIVCRSHGAPIRMREGSLPVVTSCRDNFTARGPAAADPDCILDQETLSAMTLAVDRDAGGDGTRVPLEDVLAEVTAR
jgi:Fe-S-cluster containining protein